MRVNSVHCLCSNRPSRFSSIYIGLTFRAIGPPSGVRSYSCYVHASSRRCRWKTVRMGECFSRYDHYCIRFLASSLVLIQFSPAFYTSPHRMKLNILTLVGDIQTAGTEHLEQISSLKYTYPERLSVPSSQKSITWNLINYISLDVPISKRSTHSKVSSCFLAGIIRTEFL